MAERCARLRAVHLEYTHDRLLAAKLEQAYAILVSDCVRVVGEPSTARVSSDRQKEENTIASQTAALIAFARRAEPLAGSAR